MSKIEWTDETWNPLAGEHDLIKPMRWKKPRMVTMPDIFDEVVTDEQIDRIFAVMALCPQHTFQVSTKRGGRMREYMNDWRGSGRIARVIIDWLLGKVIQYRDPWPVRSIGDIDDPSDLALRNHPLPNVWLGVSVENQASADERIPGLLATPAAVRWISAEPLLGPVDLSEWMICPKARDGLSMDPSTGAYECCSDCDWTGLTFDIDWVVVGGESGPNARPMHPDWARSLRDQCAAAGVPFYVKQLSSGGAKAIKNIDAFPIDLRSQEFPI